LLAGNRFRLIFPSSFPSVTMASPKIVSFPSGLPGAQPGAGRIANRQDFTAMKTDLIEKAARIIPNPPVLVNLVSRRVRQLNQGRAPLINPAAYGMRLGQGDIALLEIIEGKISAEFADAPVEPS
jgi:DNA-directed RNA polymerase subunit omega